MQDLKNSSAEHKSFTLGNYKFTFNMLHKLYSCESYSGIIFTTEDGSTYDVVNNYSMGFRLLINNKDGWRDIPFKPDTFSFLPNGVEVREV